MATIFWDTILFVYLIEENPTWGGRVNELLDWCERYDHTIVTSTLTLGELLAGPRKRGETGLEEAFRAALRPPYVRLIPFGEGTATIYAEIRARTKIRPADAVQLACAADAGVSVFITHDKRLLGQKIPGIDFVVGLDSKLL